MDVVGVEYVPVDAARVEVPEEDGLGEHVVVERLVDGHSGGRVLVEEPVDDVRDVLPGGKVSANLANIVLQEGEDEDEPTWEGWTSENSVFYNGSWPPGPSM